MNRHCPDCGAKLHRTTSRGGIPRLACPNGPNCGRGGDGL